MPEGDITSSQSNLVLPWFKYITFWEISLIYQESPMPEKATQESAIKELEGNESPE